MTIAIDLVEQHELLNHTWPPVGNSHGLPDQLVTFMSMNQEQQLTYLKNLRGTKEHSVFIQVSLSAIYAYCFGYQDSVTYLKAEDNLEILISEAKILIEREMLDHWLKPTTPPDIKDVKEACVYLRKYIDENTGIYHDFFEYVANEMPKEDMIKFLKFEAVRNEVVDDEVALIVVGLQGQMKNAMVCNLSDECGNGSVTRFHTHWLRRLLTALGGIEEFRKERSTVIPWFTGITSNSFNMMATRSGYKYRAYGSFLITESWVDAHFQRILAGLQRVGLMDADITVYFTKHISIDPYHTEQILTAMQHQQTPLTIEEIKEVLWGAHTAVAAGTRLYKESLAFFKK